MDEEHRRVKTEVIRLLKAWSTSLSSLNKVIDTGGRASGHTGSESPGTFAYGDWNIVSDQQ